MPVRTLFQDAGRAKSPSLGLWKLLPPCVALLTLRNIGTAANLGSYDYDVPTTSTLTPSLRRSRVDFVPFPHKSLGSGEDAACRWTTRSVPSNTTYDSIQRAAFEEGMCMPISSKGPSLHVFSSAEARECLSPTRQGRNISLTMSGDSYTRQMFIGLADILLLRPSKQETKDKEVRITTLEQSNHLLAQKHGNDTSFPDVQYRCFSECYGTYSDHLSPFSIRCSECVNNVTQLSDDSIAVVGAGVHNIRYHNRNEINGRINPWGVARSNHSIAAVNDAIDDVRRFLDRATRTTYVSVPSYELSKVPKAYRNASHHTLSEILYEGLLDSLAPRHSDHPFIDVFQLTKSCHFANCSYDGGHRARYVNRWKAQLLLNTLCEVHSESSSTSRRQVVDEYR